MTDETVRLKATADLEAAEQQIENLKTLIADGEQHAEEVRRFLAMYRSYQPTEPAFAAFQAADPSDDVVVAAFNGRER